jgi:L-2,4-diaminobutyric acid acetyltransferase
MSLLVPERPSATGLHVEAGPINFRHPRKSDGSAINDLIAECGVLDENSVYCNFLQCTHFASTCLLAERGDEIVGWVSGYRLPEDPEILFIWQVAVSAAARGQGLASRLITGLLAQDSCAGVNRLKTTITPENEASWALFSSVAEQLDADFNRGTWLESEAHFDGAHETEHMVEIGPFMRLARAA